MKKKICVQYIFNITKNEKNIVDLKIYNEIINKENMSSPGRKSLMSLTILLLLL